MNKKKLLKKKTLTKKTCRLPKTKDDGQKAVPKTAEEFLESQAAWISYLDKINDSDNPKEWTTFSDLTHPSQAPWIHFS